MKNHNKEIANVIARVAEELWARWIDGLVPCVERWWGPHIIWHNGSSGSCTIVHEHGILASRVAYKVPYVVRAYVAGSSSKYATIYVPAGATECDTMVQ